LGRSPAARGFFIRNIRPIPPAILGKTRSISECRRIDPYPGGRWGGHANGTIALLALAVQTAGFFSSAGLLTSSWPEMRVLNETSSRWPPCTVPPLPQLSGGRGLPDQPFFTRSPVCFLWPPLGPDHNAGGFQRGSGIFFARALARTTRNVGFSPQGELLVLGPGKGFPAAPLIPSGGRGKKSPFFTCPRPFL